MKGTCSPRIRIYKLPQFLVVLLALLRVHRDPLVDGLRDVVRVVRMERDAPAAHEDCRASELGDHEHAVPLGLACDVLERDKVHAVTGRGEQADVGDGVERRELGEGDGAVHVYQGGIIGGGCCRQLWTHWKEKLRSSCRIFH